MVRTDRRDAEPVKEMGASFKKILLTLVAVLVGFALVTLWALESSGVAVIETRGGDGTIRSAHVWFAEPGGELWLEAGTPQAPWFLDIQVNPEVTFSASRRSGVYRAHPLVGEPQHRKIRALLREKYGARDRWVGLLVDTSDSIAVRLSVVEAE